MASPAVEEESAKKEVPRLPISLTRVPDMQRLPGELLAEYEPVGEDLLGEGAFAIVCLLRHRQNSDLFALKAIEKHPLRIRNMMEQMSREVRIQQNLTHPNILRLVRAYDDEFYVYMLLEYCAKGSLRTLMCQLPNRRFEEPQAAFYFEQIVKGVAWMHLNSCVHRDLKLENMLLSEQDVVKICDFGWSAEMQIESILKTTCGTTSYWAPEIWENAPQDEAVDMWALGCMLYEMVAGHAPFHEQEHNKLKEKVLKLEFGYPPWFSNEACHAVHILLQRSPAQRAKCADLISHAWFGQRSIATCDAEVPPPPPQTLQADASQRNLAHARNETPAMTRQIPVPISISVEAPPAKRTAVVLRHADLENGHAPSASLVETAPLELSAPLAKSVKSVASSPLAVDRWRLSKPVEAGTPKGSFTGHRAASVGPIRRSPLVGNINGLSMAGPTRSQSNGPSRLPPSPMRASPATVLASESLQAQPPLQPGPILRKATVIGDRGRMSPNRAQPYTGSVGTSLLDCSLQQGSAAMPPLSIDTVQGFNALIGSRTFGRKGDGSQMVATSAPTVTEISGVRNLPRAIVASTGEREFVDLGTPSRCNVGNVGLYQQFPVAERSAPLSVGAMPTAGSFFQQPLASSSLPASQHRPSPNMVPASPTISRSRTSSDHNTLSGTNRAVPARSQVGALPHSNSGKLLPLGSCAVVKQSSFSVPGIGVSPRTMFCA